MFMLLYNDRSRKSLCSQLLSNKFSIVVIHICTFMCLTLFAGLTYISGQYGMFRLYYYGFLLNEGVGLFLEIQQHIGII